MKRLSAFYSYIFVFMALAFIGQSSANLLMNCQVQMPLNHSAHQTISTEAFAELPPCHQAMVLAEQTEINKNVNDCCQEQCKCSTNACSSVFLVTLLKVSSPRPVSSMPDEQAVQNVLPAYLSNLYKPPINTFLA